MAMDGTPSNDVTRKRAEEHSGGAAFRVLSTFGIATMTFLSIETTIGALCWSMAGLFGLPNWLVIGMFALLSVFGVWASVWTAFRNWHVEKRLEAGLEIDEPNWSIGAHLKRA